MSDKKVETTEATKPSKLSRVTDYLKGNAVEIQVLGSGGKTFLDVKLSRAWTFVILAAITIYQLM